MISLLLFQEPFGSSFFVLSHKPSVLLAFSQ
nr:MAG TPA: hypothetical protein [Caudoviricetes sp.]